jgi:hypothetical protein
MMKHKTLISMMVVLCLLAVPSMVLAQGPSPEPQEGAVPGTLEFGSMEYSSADKNTEDSTSLSGVGTRSIEPSGDIFYILNNAEPGQYEIESEVAYGYNLSGAVGSYYMVVYEENWDIKGAIYLPESGDISHIQISGRSPYHSGLSCNPEVSYEYLTNQFVVFWEYDFYGDETDNDIHAATVDPETGDISPIFPVHDSFTNEKDPDIACTLNTNQCLVVFDSDDGSGVHSILGQHITINPDAQAPETYYDAFQINTATNCKDAHIAYSPDSDLYLVAYTGYYYAPLKIGYFSHVRGSYLEGPFQWTHLSTFWRYHPGDPVFKKYYPTSVTYDNCTERFLIAYMYDYSGSDGASDDWDVEVIAVNKETNHFFNIPVATSFAHETEADISFLWAPSYDDTYGIGEGEARCDRMDKVIIAYERWNCTDLSEGVLVTEIIGNGDAHSPSYSVPDHADHILVAEHLSNSDDYSPSIAGGGGIGEFLVTFSRGVMESGKPLYDFISRIMNASLRSYVPLINH